MSDYDEIKETVFHYFEGYKTYHALLSERGSAHRLKPRRKSSTTRCATSSAPTRSTPANGWR